jgi:cytochrome oxidase Cu insertion factor (SCO1/SenC/PrrC family)
MRHTDSRPRLVFGRALVLLSLASVVLVQLSCSSLFHSARLPEAERAPVVGATAPDFTLVDERGNAVSSSSLRGQQTVLVFYRGFW